MIGTPELIVLMMIGIVCGLLGAAIGAKKNQPMAGFILSFLLGPLGVLVMLVVPSAFPKCPECKGDVNPGARRCKNCGVIFATPK